MYVTLTWSNGDILDVTCSSKINRMTNKIELLHHWKEDILSFPFPMVQNTAEVIGY